MHRPSTAVIYVRSVFVLASVQANRRAPYSAESEFNVTRDIAKTIRIHQK